MVAIKICGMKDLDNIVEILQQKPNYIGFILWNQSPRYVGDDFSLTPELREHTQTLRVGVFVNQSFEQITYWQERLSLSVIQLHGDEAPGFCYEIKKALPQCEIWKAIPIVDQIDQEQLKLFSPSIDRFLFDTKSEQRGGSGRVFSWQALHQNSHEKPVVLSGGIGLENISEALELTRRIPAISIIDLNSRLESAIGIKDPQKVQQAITTINKT